MADQRDPESPAEVGRRHLHERLLRRADERLLVELWRFFDVVDVGPEPYLYDPLDALALGTLENVVDALREVTRWALSGDGDAATSHDPQAGRTATEHFAWQLRWQLRYLYPSKAPLDPLPGNYLGDVDVDELIDLAGGPTVWEQTRACDRPLLVLRRVVRKAVDPSASMEIPDPRAWWQSPKEQH